jgi:excisionase family DNA binding protein
MPPMRDPDLLSPGDVAAMLGLSPTTVRRRLRAGLIPGMIDLGGGRMLVSRPQLLRWLHGDALADGGDERRP